MLAQGAVVAGDDVPVAVPAQPAAASKQAAPSSAAAAAVERSQAPADSAARASSEPEAAQATEPVAEPPPPSVIDLQRFRQVTQGRAPTGAAVVTATLTDLNPLVHAWYLLELRDTDGRVSRYHLELPAPLGQRLLLDSVDGSRLLITGPGGDVRCDLSGEQDLTSAVRRHLAYAPLCNGHLYLRQRGQGSETALETAVEFLRDRVWGGEAIVDAVKERMVAAQAETAERGDTNATHVAGVPAPARVASELAGTTIEPGRLGIALADPAPPALGLGQWYPARAQRGVYVSVIEPGAVAPEILAANTDRAAPLDSVERKSTVYLIAFDLARYELAYALGTDHPRVDWSPRAPRSGPHAHWPGPDGFATVAPLAMTGLVPPWQAPATVATFAAGFKRQHGGFKSGDLARVNNGSHYGFVQEGVVLSTLQPGLATTYVLVDGSVHMGTWSAGDDRKLELVRYARQNGVALVERDPRSGDSVPGALVNRWGPGNWSGSSESVLRSVRAGLCIATRGAERLLIYAYFSAATPSAMARVFQAYDCDYAMLLDMNALVHTYFALYHEDERQVASEFAVNGMGDVDTMVRGRRVPRFLASPDNRDFFYVLRRQQASATSVTPAPTQ